MENNREFLSTNLEAKIGLTKWKKRPASSLKTMTPSTNKQTKAKENSTTNTNSQIETK